MPIYEYKCELCGLECEVLQPMGSEMSEPCSNCGGPLERIPSSTSMNFGRFSSRSSRRSNRLAWNRTGLSSTQRRLEYRWEIYSRCMIEGARRRSAHGEPPHS